MQKPRSGLGVVTGLFAAQAKEEKPKPRRRHASTCLFPSMDYQQVSLLVIGGDDSGTINDCWLLDIAEKMWRSVGVANKRGGVWVWLIRGGGGCG